MEFRDLSVMALGVFFFMVYHRRTGWPCGGLVAPGLMALQGDPWAMPALVGLSVLVFLPLRLLVLRFGLYGREKVGAALLMALGLKGLLLGLSLHFPGFVPQFFADPQWLGFVVPGIAAAEAESAGLLPVAAGLVSVGAVTAMAASLLWG
ncbi:MAG: poly-gamma-glutamate biosynthesis protein PgsC/CapC [Thermanaerothrix sp.]|nr:poly-gamma-glutamate biosynthesis protein PgsC/CapC [Thermanaerothrix sp.]